MFIFGGKAPLPWDMSIVYSDESCIKTEKDFIEHRMLWENYLVASQSLEFQWFK